MDVFLKAAAGVLVAVILVLVLMKQGKDLSVLLIVAVCAMVLCAALSYLQPIKDLIIRLQTIGQLDSDTLSILLKAVGIGLIAEVTGLICADAGNAAMGKTLQFLASAVILWLAIPLLNELLELLDTILGAI
ncbi:MAG: hypothetical protein IKK41_06190 [Oscillospiraceae bacterium]|nr:hypothetical protein [Oscillospiraceae bacterium]